MPGIPQLRSYVDGEWRGDGVKPDINPARPTEVVAIVQPADARIATDAIEAAHRAFDKWRATPAPMRGEILREAADLIQQRADLIAVDFAREEGKAIAEAKGEVSRAVAIFRYYAAQTLEPDGETYPSHSADTLLLAFREPLGVVLAITPWNFPAAIPAWKIAPALAYGNTVVWKPAELVPLTSVRICEALVDAGLPPGVLNLVLGESRQIGDTMVTHPQLEAITFTGSNEVGRRIQSLATATGTKVQLELGGKNPAVVLADADLGQAAELVARGAFLSAGQKCTATSRVIVHRKVFEPFCQRLAEIARTWRVGDPLETGTQVGPLVSKARLDAVADYLKLAQTEGATAMAGGSPADDLGDGFFIRPTVLVGLPAQSRVVREEIFGPVAAVLPCDDLSSALCLANDTKFGLSASLFTRDLGSTLRFVRELDAGVIKINQESAGLEFQVPFGGVKASSSGSREQGKVARDFFTRWKTLYLDPPATRDKS